MKKITLYVHSRYECPFRYVPDWENAFGPAFIMCEHENGEGMLCPDKKYPVDARDTKEFPTKCPLKNGDVCGQ